MSGFSYESYRENFANTARLHSTDEGVRKDAHRLRSASIHEARAKAGSVRREDLPKRDIYQLYDSNLVKSQITSPAKGVKRVWVVLIDNSGSNKEVALKLRQDSGYIMSILNSLDPESQIAQIYFSDHCDDEKLMQEIDFVFPDQKGDQIILSTLYHIRNASGGDEAEAIECVLKRASEINFNQAQPHLILVTDVVAHGMGLHGDDGCPFQCDWRKSVELVNQTFASFTVVGSGLHYGNLQKKFLAPERQQYDLLDLSSIRETEFRLGMTANAILFFIARQLGKEKLELFLANLYEKWLKNPLFGTQTDARAKEAIRRFGKFIELPEAEVEALMKKVLLEDE